jgi:hypothetical protein
MATTKKNPDEITETTVEDTLEEVHIPKGYANDEPNLFVSVNGVNYLLPKGKTSKVPPHIAYELKRSIKAQQMQDEHIDKMTAKPE